MHKIVLGFFVAWLVWLTGAGIAYAQQPKYFNFKNNTGENYVIVIDNVLLDGVALNPGDEVGVFTSSGVCVGAAVLSATLPVTLTAWADDSQTVEIDGFRADEKMSFRIVAVDTTRKWAALALYTLGNGSFGYGPYAHIRSLAAVTDYVAPSAPQLQTPADNSNFTNNWPALTWVAPVDANNDSLHFKIEIAGDAQFTNPISGSPFESKKSLSGFTPILPIQSAAGTISFVIPNPPTMGTYWWRVTAWDGSVYGATSPAQKFTLSPSGVATFDMAVASDYALLPNFPNPFNPSTTISFTLPQSGNVRLQILDLAGRQVKRLLDQCRPTGLQRIAWHGDNDFGQRVASGNYICRMAIGNMTWTQRLILLK